MESQETRFRRFLIRTRSRLFLLHPRSLLAQLRTRPTKEHVLRSQIFRPNELVVGESSILGGMAIESQGFPFTKWFHYFDVYESRMGLLAERSRNFQLAEPLRILEIGVWRGGSLDLWREYFGPSAVIFGVDIDESCRAIPERSGQIRIGSQVDHRFMKSVVEEMGGLDIVIDDGSHVNQHVIESFRILFPYLGKAGYYWIEDLHTSYWPRWGGGFRRRSSSISFLQSLVDEMHRPYFKRSPPNPLSESERSELRSVEFFDSVALVRKGDVGSPKFFFGGQLDTQTSSTERDR